MSISCRSPMRSRDGGRASGPAAREMQSGRRSRQAKSSVCAWSPHLRDEADSSAVQQHLAGASAVCGPLRTEELPTRPPPRAVAGAALAEADGASTISAMVVSAIPWGEQVDQPLRRLGAVALAEQSFMTLSTAAQASMTACLRLIGVSVQSSSQAHTYS